MKVLVGFSTTSSLGSRIVRWFTHSTVSHCWLLVGEPGKTQTVIEAACTGVQERRYCDFLADLNDGGKEVAVIDPGVDMTKGVEFARWCMRDHYGWMEDVGDGFNLLGRMFRLTVHNPWYRRRRWNCSQLIARALQYADYPGADAIYCPDATPDDLYRLLKARG